MQELAKVKKKVKGLEQGPRHFEHILMNPPIPPEVMRVLFQVIAAFQFALLAQIASIRILSLFIAPKLAISAP